jgi:hypothetical protein
VKVGDLVMYRYSDIIALVVGKTSHSDIFEVFELSGDNRTGVYDTDAEDWEVISESR